MGFKLITAYFGQLAANPAGGEKQGESWKGDIGTSIFLDLERLLNWKRGYFIVSFSYINPGKSLSPDFIENQFPVQLHTGDEDGAARLVHLAFGQQLFDNKAEIVLGRIITGHDPPPALRSNRECQNRHCECSPRRPCSCAHRAS